MVEIGQIMSQKSIWSWSSNKFVATVFCHFRATSDTGDPLKYTQEPKTALESRKYICMINVG